MSFIMQKVIASLIVIIAVQVALVGLGVWLMASHESLFTVCAGLVMVVANGLLLRRVTLPLIVKIYVEEYLPSPIR